MSIGYTGAEYIDFGHGSARPSHMHCRFMPYVLAFACPRPGLRVLDVGCGNGYTCGEFLRRGCDVTGIDLSETGIAIARRTYPAARFEILPADGNILAHLDSVPFDVVVSTEVVEHLYSPRSYVRGVFTALNPCGRFILTTPYHGYLKNLAVCLKNGWDFHHDPLRDCGHIKFWSRATITRLLTEAGFSNVQFRGAGRLPYLWMTMVVCADKPDK